MKVNALFKYDIRDLTDKEYTYWYSLMNADKKKRVDRFRFLDDRKRTVAGEMLARQAIAEWCSVQPDSIEFAIGEHGKPFAVGLDVEFNISHSGDMVVCAVDSHPVGIDIEKIRPIDLSITKHICTHEQLLYIFRHNPTDKDFTYTEDADILTRFFELWTAKEAYGKCVGTGIVGANYNISPNRLLRISDDQYSIAVYTIISKVYLF